MPKHVRSIECCYCGASTLVNLKDAASDSLKCSECGAGMAVGKMKSVSGTPDAAGWNGEFPRRLAPEWKGDTGKRGPNPDDYRPRKKKKKSGFFDIIDDIWDEVEDLFD